MGAETVPICETTTPQLSSTVVPNVPTTVYNAPETEQTTSVTSTSSATSITTATHLSGSSDISSATSSTGNTSSFGFGKVTVSSHVSSTTAVNSCSFDQPSGDVRISMFGENPPSSSQSTNVFEQATQQNSTRTLLMCRHSSSTQQSSMTTSLFDSTLNCTTTTTSIFFGHTVSSPASTTTAPSTPSQRSGFGCAVSSSNSALGEASVRFFRQVSSGRCKASLVFGGTRSTPNNSVQSRRLLQTRGSSRKLYRGRSNTRSSPEISFSGDGSSLSDLGFGSFTSQNNHAGGFSSSLTYSATPSFGGSPTFSSPGNLFICPLSSTGSFGSGSQHSTMFENLTSQGTILFSNITQSQNQQAGSDGLSEPPSHASVVQVMTFGSAAQGTQSQAPALEAMTFKGNSFTSWR